MQYVQHRFLAETFESWIERLSGDEWGEFMVSLLGVYQDSDMTDDEEQDYLLTMVLKQFRAIDFETIFDYMSVTLSEYKDLVDSLNRRRERDSKSVDWRTKKTVAPLIEEAVALLPEWMVKVSNDLPDYVTDPNFLKVGELKALLEEGNDDAEVIVTVGASEVRLSQQGFQGGDPKKFFLERLRT